MILILFLVFTEFITRTVLDVILSTRGSGALILPAFWVTVLAILMLIAEYFNPDLGRIVDVIFGER